MIGLREFAGSEVGPWLADVARLRMRVFGEYPHLYEGSLEHERDYVETCARSAHSLSVLAFDRVRVVGASTAVPLVDEIDAFRKPFDEQGIDPHAVFYFGESVLLRDYRGRGIGSCFFDSRKARAHALARLRWTACCSVVRADNDPRRPPQHDGNETLSRRRGHAPRADLHAQLAWQEHGHPVPIMHRLAFWRRPLQERTPCATGRAGGCGIIGCCGVIGRPQGGLLQKCGICGLQERAVFATTMVCRSAPCARPARATRSRRRTRSIPRPAPRR